MFRHRISFLISFLILCSFSVSAQESGMATITSDELYTHLSFIASDELKGRNAPSPGLKVASRYLASQVKSFGFKPILPEDSFFQEIPLEITQISERQSFIRVNGGSGEKEFFFRRDFGVDSNSEAEASGSVVFLGYGIDAPEFGWDDIGDLDLEGKVIVILDGELPEDHELRKRENRRIRYRRYMLGRLHKTAAVLSVIDIEREENFINGGYYFDNPEKGRVTAIIGGSRYSGSMSSKRSIRAEIRHEMAADILGITKDELAEMFRKIGSGEQVGSRVIEDKTIDLKISITKSSGFTRNVVAYLEGSDPVLKDEYVFFGSHYDHVGAKEGKVWNGADDDGSGTVAMLEIAEAMSVERPKRSVVMVWHTGEEKGLWGANYIVRNCPVPLEKISAQLQMDMLSRNSPDSIYAIGTHFLSSELDQINRDTASEIDLINLNDLYNDPDKPGNFHHQSDHYSYHQAGIPAIFYFCGTYDDLHQPTDTIEKCNMDKLERVTKLVYAVGLRIGNYGSLLKLDKDPDITSRGLNNLK